ncbi:hypothetical protein GOODEAATRI_026605 [Goodea atripinnis]|uniref:Uncharacterized protein n=1 Tax=Goodea atripinnis TaxID=208336 RepID=A0ABV0NRT9_9TELE
MGEADGQVLLQLRTESFRNHDAFTKAQAILSLLLSNVTKDSGCNSEQQLEMVSLTNIPAADPTPASGGSVSDQSGRSALTSATVHHVGLDDGALPADVFSHGRAAHLQMFYLQQEEVSSIQVLRAPTCITVVSMATCSSSPSPPASTSPAGPQQADGTAPQPHHQRAQQDAGTEDCLLRTDDKDVRGHLISMFSGVYTLNCVTKRFPTPHNKLFKISVL